MYHIVPVTTLCHLAGVDATLSHQTAGMPWSPYDFLHREPGLSFPGLSRFEMWLDDKLYSAFPGILKSP